MVLFVSGYVIGIYHTTHTEYDDMPVNMTQQTPGKNVEASLHDTDDHEYRVSNTSCSNTINNSNLIDYLNHSDADSRLNALFFIWRHDKVQELSDDIAQLAKDDPDQLVSSFAKWTLQDKNNTEYLLLTNDNPSQPNPTVSDYVDPDTQIAQSLTEDPYLYEQGNEVSGAEQNLLEPMHQLPEEEKLEYVKELVELHEDQSIQALTELISHYNPKLQTAAIEGLINLLEMQTGHFDTIAKSLEDNHVYLSDDQLSKFRSLTQTNDEE
jgi:hypothetical protein